MRIGREEAADLLGKWLTEATPLQCSFSFPGFTACLRGKIFRVGPDEFGVISEDKSAELALRLEPWMEFGYGESRGTEDATRFEGGLVIFFRSGAEGEEPDFISLTEIIT